MVQIHPPQPTFSITYIEWLKSRGNGFRSPVLFRSFPVTESLVLMLLSCCPAAVCRPPTRWSGVWFSRTQSRNDSSSPDVRVSHFGGDQRQCDLNHIMQRSAGDTLAVKNEAQPRLSGEYKKLKNIVSMRSKLSMSDFAVGMLGSAA